MIKPTMFLPNLALILCAVFASSAHAETIRIAIGHQSKCTDTYSAGIIVKELELIQKFLPKDGKYKDAKFEFVWKDYSSGSPITNQMMANKLDFGVMGDYPLIVNGAKFQETESLETLYVAGTGYNLNGSGNAIVVPVDSDIYTLSDLKGKSISCNKNKVSQKINQLEEFPTVIIIHRGIDEEISGKKSSWKIIHELKNLIPSLIACAGGIDLSTVHEPLTAGGDILIIGRAIYQADNPLEALLNFYQTLP